MHMRDIVVEVRNGDLERLGQILLKDIKSILLEDQFNNVGSWQLQIASDHPLASALREPGAGIIVTAHDGSILLSGPTIKPENAVTVEDVKGTLTVDGLTDTVLLADRLAFPDPTNVDPETQTLSHDVRTGTAESLMHAYVNANIGPGAPLARRDTRLQMGTNGNRGPTLTKRARFPVLGNLINELASTANLGFRVVQVDDHLEFQTFEVQDRSDSIRLDVRNNMLAGHRVASGPPGATRAVVAGQGEQEDRTFVEVTTVDSLAAETLWRRRIERFVDQRNTNDPAELTQAGLEELAEAGLAQFAAQVVPMEDFALEYGHDWFLGDVVAVVVEGVELASIVTGYVVRRSAEGFRMGAILGDPFAKNRAVARLNKVEARVSNLERNTGVVQDLGPRIEALEEAVDALETTPIGTAGIANGAVTADKLATDSVTNVKMANNAVNTAEIVDGAVTNAKLGTDAVTNAKVANSAINTPELVDGAVTTAKIQDGAVTSAKLAVSAYPNTTLERTVGFTLSHGTTSYTTVSGISASITKQQASTLLRVQVGGSFFFNSGAAGGALFAVRIGSTDYEIDRLIPTVPTNVRLKFGGVLEIPSIAAGSVSVTLRVRMFAASGTVEMDGNDYAFIELMEVSS